MAVTVLLCFVVPSVAKGAPRTGYEVALSGATSATYGERFRAAGTAYAVMGLADLVPLSSGTIEAEIRTFDTDRRAYVSLSSGRFAIDRSGRFELDLAVPARIVPSAELHVVVGRRGGEGGREMVWPLSFRSPHELDLLTDRGRYEAGETIHSFVRATYRASGAPLVEGQVHVVVRDPSGRVVAERDVVTRRSGAISIDVALPDTANDGRYTVAAELRTSLGAPSATRVIEVGRRTVERLMVTPTLDRDVVPPSGVLSGTVSVKTPSGAVVARATVEIVVGQATTSLTTDAEGIARFRLSAPAYLSGDFTTEVLRVRVRHAAHGALEVPLPYTLSRTEIRIEAVAENGALVPEVPTRVHLHVTTMRGAAVAEGTPIEVEGPGVEGGRARVTTDVHGFATVPMRVAAGQAGPIEAESPCRGARGVVFHATVDARRPYRAELCAPVATEAAVRVRVGDAIVTKGARVAVEIARRPGVARAVLVEALVEGVPVATAWIERSATRGTLSLPADLEGLVLVRARPFDGGDARRARNEEGGVSFGVGSLDALIVRPSDAFALSLTGSEEPYPVGGTATIGVRRSNAESPAYATMVARDLAQHGGEGDYALAWLARFDAQVTRPDLVQGERLVRAALASAVALDPEARGVAPLVVPVWDETPHGDSSPALHRGELRDPLRVRDELVRRGIGQVMMALEAAVDASVGDDESGVVRRAGGRSFAPGAVSALVENGLLSSDQIETLGGEPMTLAMLEAEDASFRFDTVAARIARRRLVLLLDALLAFTDPESEDALRASAGVKPERWLSHLVSISAIAPETLLDPWGRSFVFRRTANPRFVVSDRAPDFELLSLGPDGRAGTSDDVSDPFRRVVAEGTPYAVASGEDLLIHALSTIAPGEGTLRAMLAAYRSMSLAASEERTAQAVVASASEAYDDAMPMAAEAAGFGGLGISGRGVGGGGYGSGYGVAAQRAASPSAAQPAPPEAIAESSDRGSTLARVGERIRERFPATLFFAGEIALAGADTEVRVPLADALTTYRVEAIAWTDSGFVATGRTEIRVDQTATVDAPIPGFATVGDVLRIPVRVANRSNVTLVAKVGLDAEGLGIDAGSVRTLEVPPRDARATTFEVRATTVSEGAIVVRAVRASDGAPLDAARRPFRIFADARVVRETRHFVAEGRTEVTFEVPASATPRGPAELRVATGMEFFGALPRAIPEQRVNAAWAYAFARRPIDAETANAIAHALHHRAGAELEPVPIDLRPLALRAWSGETAELARLVGAGWGERAVADADLARALELLSQSLPERGERPSPDAQTAVDDARLLLFLAPTRHTRRAELEDDRDRVIARLRAVVSAEAARLPYSVLVAVSAAAALASTSDGDDDRAKEMLRRLARDEIRVGDATFLELTESYGHPHARELPTTLLAVAELGLGNRLRALACLRGLTRRTERAFVGGSEAPYFAAAVIGSLVAGTGDELDLTVDGRRIPTTDDGGVRRARLEGLDRPGRHTLSLALPENALAVLDLDLRYGLPWTVAEPAPLRIDVAIEGAALARDTRTDLALVLRNRTARALRTPVVEVDLPAGTELDEPARAALTELLAEPPTLEGRTLRLVLRPLAPGARTRIPLPLRFSVSGALRGLGVVVTDEANEASARPRTAILAPRVLGLSDQVESPR